MFVLMLIVLSLTGDVIEVCSVHVGKRISHMHPFTANGTYFIAFLALSSTHIIPELSSKFDQYVCLDANSHNPEFY